MAKMQGVGGVLDVPEATFGFTGRDAPSLVDMQLTAVTSHGWRVSDARLPFGDPFRLLAFIERRGDVFEVMQLGAGFEWHEFGSMDSALAFVLVTGPRAAQERLHGELGWLR